ncbi:SWI/SNF and RSC complex subunit Ssr3, partial [Spiromyces aspiralis]
MNTEAKQGDTNKSADSVEVKDDEIPSWTLRIEGRLIDPPGTTWKNRPAPRKFTEFIQSLIVELDRDPNQYKDNTVSWNRSLATEDMDGFEIKRMGDQNVKARILIQPCTPTDKYELTSPALCDLLDIRGAVTRAEVIRGLWQYIKLNDLQDPNDSEL